MKDSGGNTGKFAQIAGEMKRLNRKFQLLAGSASFLFPAMAVGGEGGVCALANIAGKELLEMMEHTKNGNFSKAA